MSRKRHFGVSVKLKVLAGFLFIGIISSLLVGALTFWIVGNHETTALKSKLVMVAQMASAVVDADAHGSLKPGDEGKAPYAQLLRKLRNYKKISGLTYLYTLAPNDGKKIQPGDTKVRFILDTDETSEQAPIGKEYDLQPEIQAAFDDNLSVTEDPYTDEWGTFYSGFAPVRNAAGDVVAIIGADISLADVYALQRQLLTYSGLGVGLTIVFCVLAAWFYVRNLVRPLEHLRSAVKRFSENDFSARSDVTSRDEIGDLSDSFNAMADMIQESHQIMKQQVEERTRELSELASSIEETSSTLGNSAEIITRNTKKTKEAAVLAAQTKVASDRGNSETREMLGFMNNVKKSSDEVAKIIKVISEIAFQTNILSLNAAVEAARAGDLGKGFAVVAEEVRNLAQRTAVAANDTSGIIKNNIELSQKGFEAATRVGESLTQITEQADKVSTLMNEIDSASSEQALAIQRINMILSEMGKASDENVLGTKAEDDSLDAARIGDSSLRGELGSC